MGIISFLKEVDEENDRVTVRPTSGLNVLGPVLLFSGLVVGGICLPVALYATGSDQRDLTYVVIASVAAMILGVILRKIGPKRRIDFRSKEVTQDGVVYPFSRLAFVAITEQVRTIRTENQRIRVPHFNATLAFGELGPQRIESTAGRDSYHRGRTRFHCR